MRKVSTMRFPPDHPARVICGLCLFVIGLGAFLHAEPYGYGRWLPVQSLLVGMATFMLAYLFSGALRHQSGGIMICVVLLLACTAIALGFGDPYDYLYGIVDPKSYEARSTLFFFGATAMGIIARFVRMCWQPTQQ